MEDKKMALAGHLDELRRRIMVSLLAFIIGSIAAYYFAPQILHILKTPAGPELGKFKFLKPAEGFITYMNISLAAGLIVSSPVMLYHIWAFAAPAISEKAHRYILIFIFATLACFLSGCAFAYFILLPPALKFLLYFAQGEMEYIPTAGEYISFTTSIILYSGLIFLLPVFAYILTKLKVITSRLLLAKWRYITLGSFIAAAIITPTPDVFNMTLVAIPILLLYGVSIAVSAFAQRQ